MNARSSNAALTQQITQYVPVSRLLREQDDVGRLDPDGGSIERQGGRRGWLEDPGVGDDGEKLVDARPRNAPRACADLTQSRGRGVVPRRIGPVCVYQDVMASLAVRRHQRRP